MAKSKLKLFLLHRISRSAGVDRLVVRATDEAEARKFAVDSTADRLWKLKTCANVSLLEYDGCPGIILVDYACE